MKRILFTSIGAVLLVGSLYGLSTWLTMPFSQAQQTFYTETEIFNTVYDRTNRALRMAPGTVVLSSTTFATLGTPVNGTLGYCSDCTLANPCAGGGTGALAKRLNNTWVCN